MWWPSYPHPLVLAFLSTAEGKTNSDQEYDYLAPAGAGTRVYMRDRGVDTSHPDLQDTRTEWDWAVDLRMEMTDDDVLPPDYEGWMKGHGVCTTSLIGGGRLGVRSQKLRPLGEYEDQPNCCFDARWPCQSRIRTWKTECQKPPEQGPRCGQYPGHFSPISQKTDENALNLGDLVKILVNITPAGVDRKLTGANIDGWPSLLAANYDILFNCSWYSLGAAMISALVCQAHLNTRLSFVAVPKILSISILTLALSFLSTAICASLRAISLASTTRSLSFSRHMPSM